MVRVRESVAVHFNGAWQALVAGQKFEPNDPLVRAFPMHFESDMEDASAAPGSRRGAR